MDPTASFVVTARDETAAAIKSANQNLQSLQKTARDLRQLFLSFGAAFGARAFVNWIEGALSAVKVTDDTAQAIKDAKKSLEDMESASTSLALNFSTSLKPAMDLITATLTGWNRIIFNADPFPFEKEIKDLEDKIHGVQLEAIRNAQEYGDVQVKFTQDQEAAIAGYNAQIEELKKRQNDEGMTWQAIAKRRQDAIDKLMVSVQTPGKMLIQPKVEFDFDQAIKDVRSKVADFQRQGEIDALIIDLPPIPLKLEPIPDFEPFKAKLEDDFEDVGKSLGRGLHDSLVDFLVDGEMKFKDFLKRLAAEVAVSGLFDIIATGAGPTSFIGKVFGGFKAEGGPLNQGKWYVAGEHGPEPIWGGGAGAFAMGYGGGGGDVHVSIQQNFTQDLTPDRAAAMGQVIAQSVFEAVEKRRSGRR